MGDVRGYIRITENAGFNELKTPYGVVSDDDELFLRQKPYMISLGTYSEAMNRAYGHDQVIGINNEEYGHFGTPKIDNNLFILDNPMPPLPPPPSPHQTVKNIKHNKPLSRGSRSRMSRSRRARSRMSRSRRARSRMSRSK